MFACLLIAGCAVFRDAPGPLPPGPLASAPLELADRDAAARSIDDFKARVAAIGLSPGDTVRISFPHAPELDGVQRVSPAGDVALAHVGTVRAAGRDVGSLAAAIEDAYRNVLRRPTASVALVETASPPPRPAVRVLGAVAAPGEVAFDEPQSVLDVVARAGGLSAEASGFAVVLRRERGALTRFVVDVAALLSGDDAPGPPFVRPDDIVFAPLRRVGRGPGRRADAREEVDHVLRLLRDAGGE
ncbi:MAG: polysaccharide biosynthesis/export family protein [Parvularculaceae bacterium]